MKEILPSVLMLIAFLLFTGCTDKTQLTDHFHFYALKDSTGKTFETKLKLPDKISQTQVFLTKVKYENKPIKAQQGPNQGRPEILVATLSFSTTAPDEVEVDHQNARYDEECKIITLHNMLPKQGASQYQYASIKIKPIAGISTISFSGDDHGPLPEGPCYEPFNEHEFHESHEYKGSLFFLHNGHGVEDPRSGFNGILIQEANNSHAH